MLTGDRKTYKEVQKIIRCSWSQMIKNGSQNLKDVEEIEHLKQPFETIKE